MANLKHMLPSAAWLVVFDTAGRLQNFTRTAEELGMTQAAVSYAIRAMEEQLGVPLFVRHHRSVELTEAGARFHADVSVCLARIQKSAEAIRAKGREAIVTLAASTAFASMWMLPRIAKLRQDLPEIDLRFHTSVKDLDLEEEGIPLGIRRGTIPPPWQEVESALLAPEIIYPVASPEFVKAMKRTPTLAELTELRLIHLEEPVREVCDWREWFSSAGIVYRHPFRPLLINDYVVLIQAVMAGEGIALGWDHLIGPQVKAGSLVTVGEHVLDTGAAFYVVWPKIRELTTAERKVQDWLLAHA